MKKLKHVAHAIITDRKIQCVSAIFVCKHFGELVAIGAVVGAEMLYITIDILTMSKERLAKRQADMLKSKS